MHRALFLPQIRRLSRGLAGRWRVAMSWMAAQPMPGLGRAAIAGLLSLGSLGLGPASAQDSSSGRLVFANSGGEYERIITRTVIEPFTAETGIRVTFVSGSTAERWARVQAMSNAGRMEWDMMELNTGDVEIPERRRHLMDLGDNCASVPKARTDGFADTCHRYGVLPGYGATLLVVNRSRFGDRLPSSWADFFNPTEFPGPRSLPNQGDPWRVLIGALIADGVPRNALFPLDLDRAFKSLDRVRPSIRKFWDTGALSAQMLADKEVVLGSIWNGRLQAIADKGAPVAIEWNEAALQVQFWGPLKGAKNAENAQRFIDFACQPQMQAALAGFIPYGPSNRQAFKHIPADVAARLPSSPDHKPKSFLHSAQWWADNRSKVSERWSQWLLQKG